MAISQDEVLGIGQGYVHVYTGDGKGKTTAALGLAFRAMGLGRKTYIGQFMKGRSYSELKSAVASAPYITIEQYGKETFTHIKKTRETDVIMAQAGLAKGVAAMLSGRYDIVILDEVVTSYYFKLLTLEEILEAVGAKPDGVELILTGRGAPPKLIAAADLVTEMKEVKHYYRQGVVGRAGIEC